MEAYSSGKLRKILIPEGTMVSVGTVIAYIGDENDEIPQINSEFLKLKMMNLNRNSN